MICISNWRGNCTEAGKHSNACPFKFILFARAWRNHDHSVLSMSAKVGTLFLLRDNPTWPWLTATANFSWFFNQVEMVLGGTPSSFAIADFFFTASMSSRALHISSKVLKTCEEPACFDPMAEGDVRPAQAINFRTKQLSRHSCQRPLHLQDHAHATEKQLPQLYRTATKVRVNRTHQLPAFKMRIEI